MRYQSSVMRNNYENPYIIFSYDEYSLYFSSLIVVENLLSIIFVTVTFYAQESVIHDYAHQSLSHETEMYGNARLNKSHVIPLYFTHSSNGDLYQN